MRHSQILRLAAIALLVLATGCSGSAMLETQSGPQTGAKAISNYDPLAPSIEVSPLAQALADSPKLSSGGFTITALTQFNTPDTAALDALELTGGAGSVTISLKTPLPSVALYASYDSTKWHLASLSAGCAGCIGYALEYENGKLAIGVSGVRGALLPAGLQIAQVNLAEGAAVNVLRTASITQDKRSAVDDLEAVDNSDGSATLGWSERNTGDYDLNGEVNISDITPVGLHFNTVYGTDSPNYAQLEVVDGDNNFEINISDLTPIGLNFGSTIKGYNVYRTELATEDEIPDPADTGRWTKVDNASDPSGPSAPRDFNKQDFRLRYTFVDDSGNGNFGWYVAPVGLATDVPLEGPASNTPTLAVGGGAPPEATISFEIMAPASELMNVNDEFYLAVNIEGVQDLFSANVRFEYDSDLVQFEEGVSAYDANANFLVPPLFVTADDVGPADSPYILLGFNATQTQGEATKSGDGALGYFKFKAIGTGIKDDAFRFPQASNFIYLWGDQYGVPTATPALGPAQLLNIGL